MKALALAYLSGVIHGDGWLTDRELALRVKDADFAHAFADAIAVAFDVDFPARHDERGYWLVRRGNTSGRFNSLRAFVPASAAERAAWVRGLFDSEGNAQFRPTVGGPRCFSRRVAMYSTEISTLDRALGYLAGLGVPSYIRATKNSTGHIGTKVVFELSVHGGRDNYNGFATLVGSNIARKRDAMTSMVESYKPDFRAHCREVQLRGATTKLRRTREEVIPRVIEGIRGRLVRGESITMRSLAVLPGYSTAIKHVEHRKLVACAKEMAACAL